MKCQRGIWVSCCFQSGTYRDKFNYLVFIDSRSTLTTFVQTRKRDFLTASCLTSICTVTLYQVWNPSEQSKVVRILLQFHRILLHVRAWCTQKRFRVWSLRLVLWRKIYETISWEFCVLSYRKIRTFITSLLVTCCYGRRITPLTKHDQWMKERRCWKIQGNTLFWPTFNYKLLSFPYKQELLKYNVIGFNCISSK